VPAGSMRVSSPIPLKKGPRPAPTKPPA